LIEKRFVDLYASSSGVDRLVAERDVVLTYILKMMKEDGIMEDLALKGGTCLRKIYLGRVGRFSEDLDFTLIGYDLARLERRFSSFIEGARVYGFAMSFDKLRKSWGRSFACDVQYSHEWNSGEFKFEVSLRENPVLEVRDKGIRDELYFRYTEFEPFKIPCMQLEEVLAEKIRATYQRATTRDVWDLYQYATRPYDQGLVKRLAVVKFWNDESEYDPRKLLGKIRAMKIDFSEIEYLLKNQEHPKEEEIKARILSNYGYLEDLDDALIEILEDARKHRETVLVKKTCEELRNWRIEGKENRS
jgi:predicted nucleotidyltransferase component of viral defense system